MNVVYQGHDQKIFGGEAISRLPPWWRAYRALIVEVGGKFHWLSNTFSVFRMRFFFIPIEIFVNKINRITCYNF